MINHFSTSSAYVLSIFL